MALAKKIENKNITAAVIGLGYVGLPLAVTIGNQDIPVIGYDISADHVHRLNQGHSHIYAVSNDNLLDLVSRKLFHATSDIKELSKADVIMICVPTPLDKHREPDLAYIADTARVLEKVLRPGQMIILESTTYPGTTKEVLEHLLAPSGLKAGEDYYLAFAPEREDPGNKDFALKAIPKVVGANDELSRQNAVNFYSLFFDTVVPVSSADTAEAVKLTENIFRSVNIALVNELKLIYDKMGIDIWEVIEAAKTKPFGYMPFYPGPGLGGHCIPIDPFYLSYRARAFDMPTRFIELAGEINTNMPNHVIEKLSASLDQYKKLSLSAAKILILGAAYKKNVNDMRESPAVDIMEKLKARGAAISYYDPHVPILDHLGAESSLFGMESIVMDETNIASYDAVLIVTDHDDVDYQLLANNCNLIVDTRNVFSSEKIANEYPNVNYIRA